MENQASSQQLTRNTQEVGLIKKIPVFSNLFPDNYIIDKKKTQLGKTMQFSVQIELTNQ